MFILYQCSGEMSIAVTVIISVMKPSFYRKWDFPRSAHETLIMFPGGKKLSKKMATRAHIALCTQGILMS